MKKIHRHKKWMFVPLFILVAAAVLGILGTYTHTDQKLIYLTPLLQDTKGWVLYTLEDGAYTELTPRESLDLKNEETFYLSRVLTEDLAESDVTFLFLDSQRPCSIFLDDALLYTTCPKIEQQIGLVRFPPEYKGLSQGSEYIRCTLPEGFVGKTLTIATKQPTNSSAGMPGVMLSSQARESANWMSLANKNAMPAAAFAMAILLLLGLLCYNLFQGGRDWSLLLLTAAAFAQFFYYLREYGYVSPTSTMLDTPLSYFMLPLIVILPELFLLVQMKRWRKHCAFFVLPTALLALVPPVAYLFGPLSFSDTLFFEALYIGLLALLICALLEARDKNKAFQLFLGGLGSICGTLLVLSFASLANKGFYLNYIISMFKHIGNHIPELPLYWCGTILFVLASVISVDVLMRHAVDTQTALAIQKERLERLDYESTVQKQFYEAKLGNEEELQALRHDMKSHLLTLSALLGEGKTLETTQYLSSLVQLHQDRQAEVFCQDPYMNAILYTFAAQFREHKISFICHVDVTGHSLPGMEVCLILGNALSNALEASLLLPETERSIKVQATICHNRLLLRVSNRFEGTLVERNGLPLTTKTEKGHGYGLANIRHTTEKLGGSIEYYVENGYFILDVDFPLLVGIPLMQN